MEEISNNIGDNVSCLISHFLDLLLMETANSGSALIMNRVVAFFCCLLEHMSSNPVVRMVVVARPSALSRYFLTFS